MLAFDFCIFLRMIDDSYYKIIQIVDFITLDGMVVLIGILKTMTHTHTHIYIYIYNVQLIWDKINQSKNVIKKTLKIILVNGLLETWTNYSF